MFLCFFGVDGLPCQDHFHGTEFAYCPRQSLCAACARHDSNVNLRLSELCGLRGYDDVAVHSQFAATAECVAADGCNDWLSGPLETVPECELVSQDEVNRCCFRKFFDVCSR